MTVAAKVKAIPTEVVPAVANDVAVTSKLVAAVSNFVDEALKRVVTTPQVSIRHQRLCQH